MGSLKYIENQPGKMYCVTEWMLFCEALGAREEHGAKVPRTLLVFKCAGKVPSHFCKPSCIVAEVLAHLPGWPLPWHSQETFAEVVLLTHMPA